MGLNDRISARVLRAELRDLFEDDAAVLDEMRPEGWPGFFVEGAILDHAGRRIAGGIAFNAGDVGGPRRLLAKETAPDPEKPADPTASLRQLLS